MQYTLESIIARLNTFGYTYDAEADLVGLTFAKNKAEQSVLNFCNLAELPEGLVYVTIDMACAEFLKAKYDVGLLDINSLDLSGVVTSVKEGDTQVNFSAGHSPAENFSAFLESLLTGGRGDLLRYRKLAW